MAEAAAAVSPAAPDAGSTAAALLKLMTFLSPAFPVGAFSYSHGLEWVIDRGSLRASEALRDWLSDLLRSGSIWNDAVLFAEAHRAAAGGRIDALRDIAELAAALAGSRERHIEATAQGRAFLDAVAASWPCASVHILRRGEVPYPVAVAAVAADHAILPDDALPACLNAFVSNLVSVGVRLIPIGQNAGLGVIAALHPLIASTAKRAMASTLDDLGSSTVLADIASMRHEEQYSRVFRT